MIGCNFDDDNEPQPVVTSFSGRVLYEPTMEPVTSGELFIAGRDSRGITGSIVRADTILRIDDGTFEVSFEIIEEVDRFSMVVVILQDGFIVSIFGGGDETTDLLCDPFDCRNLVPGQDYELTILVPCDPDDCVRFPP